MKISPLRALQALYRLARLVRDPNRLGEVFEMSDAVASPEALQPIVDRIARDPAVARALDERHRFAIDIPALRALPEGTLGRTFAEHMIANKLDPSALPKLPSDDRLSFFRAHLYETHDIWHVVTGYATDVAGEIGLQAFYLAQIPGPLPSLLLAVGFLRTGIYDDTLREPLMDGIVRGWEAGRRSVPLFGIRWDDLWHLPIADVRRRLRIDADAPPAIVTPLAA
jgi:ubiquinone biosynthesis protein Coq4